MVRVEYQCKYCRNKKTMAKDMGRPSFTNCPKRKNGQPHVWTKLREIK